MQDKIKLIREVIKNKGYFAKIPIMFKMFKAHRAGTFKMKLKYIIIPILTVIYVLSPLDFIPGIIIDDLGLLVFAFSYMIKEIDRYMEADMLQKDLTTIDVEAQ